MIKLGNLKTAPKTMIDSPKNQVTTLSVGNGITTTFLTMLDPCQYVGIEPFNEKRTIPHEIMITRINSKLVTFELVSNQGSPDHFMKYLKQAESSYGAVMNGGFYAINGAFSLPLNHPIGPHRFACQYIPKGRLVTPIKKDIDNIVEFANTADSSSTSISKHDSDYKAPNIDARLHLETQLPMSSKDEFALVRIEKNGQISIRAITSFSSPEAYHHYINEPDSNLMSSGPMLVDNYQNVFPEEKLKDPNFQFKSVSQYLGDHPSSIPPGTFYHADQPNPRSAIALTESDEIIFVTVKGDETPGRRDGLTLPQFAHFLKGLKVKTALNLDGGYSAYQGVFNNKKMLTPNFIKSCGNERVLPCSFLARDTSSKKQRLIESTSNRAEAEAEPRTKIRKLRFLI